MKLQTRGWNAAVAILLLLWCVAPVLADPAPPEPPSEALAIFAKPAPESVDELRLIQDHVRRLSEQVIPATVGLQIGPSQGSGVIISPDGYVLTAGHVSGDADRNAFIILPDGSRVRGKTLGINRSIDSGMIKITDEAPEGGWPHVEMGKSSTLADGQWCLAVGHPGGYQRGRTPVVRLGRILVTSRGALMSDCTLVGGDSGGPLFDMEGRVIGIHSRIGGPITANLHVPVDTYHNTWDRLAASEVWGQMPGSPRRGGPFVGVNGDPAEDQCRITQVQPESPAAKAGIEVGDVVLKFDDEPVSNFQQLVEMVGKRRPGEKVSLEVLRGEESLVLELEIGRRP